MFLPTCITYDPAIIYHKNFQPGTHPLLRFDGWYTPVVEWALYGRVKPIFFYRDGSVWFGEYMMSSDDVDSLAQTGAPHSWGNYRINGDTIELERFSNGMTGNNYNRIILKGVIMQDEIEWITRTFHRNSPDSLRYPIIFQAHAAKPDSSLNWIRKKKKYNE